MSMIHDIAARGVERHELTLRVAKCEAGGERIPYEPKELASMVTTIRAHKPQRYLAIEGVSTGGWRYIKEAAEIPTVDIVLPSLALQPFCKELRQPCQPYDLISIDSRGLPLGPEEIWKFILGGKEQAKEFGKGAPKDYGAPKLKSGTLIILNLAGEGMRDLFLKIRTMDNRMHQSQFAGMVKWT